MERMDRRGCINYSSAEVTVFVQRLHAVRTCNQVRSGIETLCKGGASQTVNAVSVHMLRIGSSHSNDQGSSGLLSDWKI